MYVCAVRAGGFCRVGGRWVVCLFVGWGIGVKLMNVSSVFQDFFY